MRPVGWTVVRAAGGEKCQNRHFGLLTPQDVAPITRLTAEDRGAGDDARDWSKPLKSLRDWRFQVFKIRLFRKLKMGCWQTKTSRIQPATLTTPSTCCSHCSAITERAEPLPGNRRQVSVL